MNNRTIKIKNDILSDEILTQIVNTLKNGGLIIYPTETAYGLGCNVFDEVAVKKIYQIKQRPENHPLPVIVRSIVKAEEIAELNPKIKQLSKKYHPGPLVIATQKKDIIPDIVNPTGIAFRISSNNIIKQVISKFEYPIISTSANLSGKATPYSITEINNQLDTTLIEVILDAGDLPVKKPSTIIDFQIEPSPQIIREGDISAKEILSELKIEKSKWKNHLQKISYD